ncbi:putative glucosyl-3-phosphoglycerate synthase [Hartmannibacter diazotrophicus]|uniref:Putative glucosyl-3-phosphoglycerate synthase n=1 Tax=Hartmannibacter diazotrophicus TaxID=1482074 RepID=A0A2C9D5N9_9HYPH|nr:glycosyltransferase family 2 protein [Hartmannibacter diazotrophicus]SON55061.1 putative glucosyl-3-phosphoglycerate synthase [Hartmannibacter diazotrophicus]
MEKTAAQAADTSVYVVVAALNEARSIAGVVGSLRELDLPLTVVVVDDGSSDGTSAIAREAGAVVLRHIFNMGQGAGLQTGIQFAVSQGAAFIVTFDADGQHEAADIPVMLDVARTKGCDVVLGSRFLGKAIGMKKGRERLLRMATALTNAMTGLELTDTHNGFRLLSRHAAASIRIRQNGMAHASEILHQIKKHGLSWSEAPVTIRYSDYSMAKGQSNLSGFGILLDIFLRRLVGGD